MKYMGSKRWQVQNGLGLQLQRVASTSEAFVDLFAGSGVVAYYAAEQLGLRVTAVDLQRYSTVLCEAVIGRTRGVSTERLKRLWIDPVRPILDRDRVVERSRAALDHGLTFAAVERLRRSVASEERVFCRSYGGYYFSPEQALAIDFLYERLPEREPDRTVCLAALIAAASRCSASPGHTAQPFKLTDGALPHISSIWRRSLLAEVQKELALVAPRHAAKRGLTVCGDAIDVARGLAGREVVFLDPPYSAAQYSRFYHVLEAVSVGGYPEVHGAGRAPALDLRRRSGFSQVSLARPLMSELMEILAMKQCTVVATFPQYRASNGLSGDELVGLAREYFRVDVTATSAQFSTMGGNGQARSARRKAQELVITMVP